MNNSNIPTFHPSSLPTEKISNAITSYSPQRSPIRDGIDSYSPSIFPSYIHTQKPTVSRPPSNLRSIIPTISPTESLQPSGVPTLAPSSNPSISRHPTLFPTTLPTSMPSVSTRPSLVPTNRPSGRSPTSLEFPWWAGVIITLVIVAIIIKYGNRNECSTGERSSRYERDTGYSPALYALDARNRDIQRARNDYNRAVSYDDSRARDDAMHRLRQYGEHL